MADITIWWPGAANATASTTYEVQSDIAAPGTFSTVTTVNATTAPNSASYAPNTTTLTAALTVERTDTAVTIAGSDTDFPDGIPIVVDQEMILKNPTYERGFSGTLPRLHADAATVTGAHESYTDTGVTFPADIYAIRYRVIRKEPDGTFSVAAESVALSVPPPPNTMHSTLYGILEDTQANIQNGLSLSLTISAVTEQLPATSVTVVKKVESATSGADGFFYFFYPRSVAAENDFSATLTMAIPGDASGSAAISETILSLPDRDTIHYLEAI